MATKRKLAGYVTVNGLTFGPDDEVPDDVAEQITNPNVWASDEEAETHAAKKESRKRAGTSKGHKLAMLVTIDGNTYGPEDSLPDDVAERITNPAVWEGGKLPDLSKPAKGATSEDEEKGSESGPSAKSEADSDSGSGAGSKPATRGTRSRS